MSVRMKHRRYGNPLTKRIRKKKGSCTAAVAPQRLKYQTAVFFLSARLQSVQGHGRGTDTSQGGGRERVVHDRKGEALGVTFESQRTSQRA